MSNLLSFENCLTKLHYYKDQINKIEDELDRIYKEMASYFLGANENELLILLQQQIYSIPVEVVTHIFIGCEFYTVCKFIFTNVKADISILTEYTDKMEDETSELIPEWKKKLCSNWYLVSQNR